MKTSLDSNDHQFLKRLHRLGSSTVQDICAEMDVTATAVRQRLSKMQILGHVSREAVRTGRGRPHHTYQVTDAGLRELGDNYADLAMTLWREMQNIKEPSVREHLLHRVRAALVQQFGKFVQGESVHERLEQLQVAMVGLGFDVEIDLSGPLPILRELNCPYFDLANSDPSICELEREVFRNVLGVEVSLSQCCLDGHQNCEFELAHERN